MDKYIKVRTTDVQLINDIIVVNEPTKTYIERWQYLLDDKIKPYYDDINRVQILHNKDTNTFEIFILELNSNGKRVDIIALLHSLITQFSRDYNA